MNRGVLRRLRKFWTHLNMRWAYFEDLLYLYPWPPSHILSFRWIIKQRADLGLLKRYSARQNSSTVIATVMMWLSFKPVQAYRGVTGFARGKSKFSCSDPPTVSSVTNESWKCTLKIWRYLVMASFRTVVSESAQCMIILVADCLKPGFCIRTSSILPLIWEMPPGAVNFARLLFPAELSCRSCCCFLLFIVCPEPDQPDHSESKWNYL